MKFSFLILFLIQLFFSPRGACQVIPVICYHNIFHHPKNISLLNISEARFDSQMRALHDNGYHTISSDQLYKFFTTGAALPSKPIMITLDDGHKEHYTIAKAILEKYGFRALFFAMTVAIDKPGFLSRRDIRKLVDDGHEIGDHTWDHQMVSHFAEQDWERQLVNPKLTLEKIVGRPIQTFAYPYGVWTQPALHELKKAGIRMAFQLSGKQDQKEPLLTLRRIMVSGDWRPSMLLQKMKTNFR